MNDELNLCRVCLQVEGSEKFVQFHIKLRRIALKISGVQVCFVLSIRFSVLAVSQPLLFPDIAMERPTCFNLSSMRHRCQRSRANSKEIDKSRRILSNHSSEQSS